MKSKLQSEARQAHLPRWIAIAIALCTSHATSAQCTGWTDGFAYPTVDGEIYAAAYFNDGSGMALYIGGIIRSAGDLRNQYLLKRSGNTFTVPFGGVNGPVSALQVIGGRLYVGGKFDSVAGTDVRNIASWGPGGWQDLGGGTNGPVYSILGIGSISIVVGGAFDEAGGVSASNIANWTGAAWTSFGTGVDGAVSSLASYGGLIAGGLFRNAGGAPADRIARWNGSAWSPVGSGANAAVRTLRSHPTGSGEILLVGGDFTSIAGVSANRIAYWNGTTYSALGDGFDRSVRALNVAHIEGPRIVAGGFFEHSGTEEVEYAAWWNGSTWQQFGAGLDGLVHTLVVAPVPAQIFLAGTSSADALLELRDANSGTWQPVASGGGGVNGEVRAIISSEEGGDPVVFMGGSFSNVAGVRVRNVARFDGTNWTAVGAGIDASIAALARRGDGSIVAAGHARDALVSVTQWDGSDWTAVGDELRGRVNAVVEYAGELFLAGEFYSIGGATRRSVQRLVSNVWTDVPDTYSFTCLAVLEDDGVPALYGGGSTGSWSQLYRYEQGVFVGLALLDEGAISSLVKFDDGSGVGLYAGGAFRKDGARVVGRVARLNGNRWERVGGGVGLDIALFADVFSLTAFDDGHGPVLYALGSFRDADGMTVVNGARWDGQSWSSVEGIGWAPRAAAVLPGDAPGLLVGGSFAFAGATGSSRLAVLGDVPLAADLDGDDDVDLQDLATLLANFSRSGDAEYEDGDIDGDRDVDFQDLTFLLSRFGAVCG